MIKIATHDSATGEKGKGLLSWLVTPFARTQSKTIAEQYAAGCRCFDIRVRKYKGEWHCAHGLWVSKRTAGDILSEINGFTERCQVDLTYEGGMKDNEEFLEFAKMVRRIAPHIIWGGVAVKYGEEAKGAKVSYTYLLQAQPEYIGGERGYLPLDGRSWHTYLPIPWLWDKIYGKTKGFGDKLFTYVDFL